MGGVLEAVSIILSLVQVGRNAYEEAEKIGALIKQAQAENRDLTNAELDAVRHSAELARARLVG
jgi:hypothetical protein